MSLPLTGEQKDLESPKLNQRECCPRHMYNLQTKFEVKGQGHNSQERIMLIQEIHHN